MPDAQIEGAVVKEALVDCDDVLLGEPVEEVDFEELWLIVNTPVDELHLDPLGELDSEVVTLGLAVDREEVLGEKDETPDTVSRKTEGVGATV